MRSILVLAALQLVALSAVPAWAQNPAASPARTGPAGRADAFTLQNGMEVVVLTDHRAPVVTHMLWYRAGSADEIPGKSGNAHFVERLMSRQTSGGSAAGYSKVIARNGGADSSLTSLDFTSYAFRVPKDRLAQIMRVEADRMAGLELTDQQVLYAREALLEEHAQITNAAPRMIIEAMVYQRMFEGHPYARSPTGRTEDIRRLKREDAAEWRRRWYGPENAVLIVAGDITAAELRPVVEEIYGPLQRQGIIGKPQSAAVSVLKASDEVTYSSPNIRQVEWARNWPGAAYGDPDSEALEIGLMILGRGRTSRLYRELVERGEALIVDSASQEHKASGVLSLRAVPTEGVSVEELQLAALTVVDQFIGEGPTEEEVTRAKNVIAADAIVNRDNQVALANWYGERLSAGLPLAYIESWHDRLNRVTPSDVRRAMKRFIASKPYIDAFLLPEPQ